MEKFYVPQSAMVIVAHPDDIEYTCAGTLSRWADSGSSVSFVLCTSGDAGINEPGITRENAIEIRETEARVGAKILGASEIIFLREPDGLLQPTLELRRRLVREIRRFKPEVVMCSDPTIVWSGNNYINHPDHRAAATAALDATFPAAGQIVVFQEFENEGIFPHKPRKVYVTTWSQADLYVNIETTIQNKIAALKSHKSQLDDWDPEPMIREWASKAAEGKEMLYAETFRVVTLIDDETWVKNNNHKDL
jgi:LmbE family N-acetylglucosaminyl deacetylase